MTKYKRVKQDSVEAIRDFATRLRGVLADKKLWSYNEIDLRIEWLLNDITNTSWGKNWTDD